MSKNTCDCGKINYASQGEARKAMKAINANSKTKIVTIYRCWMSGEWHLSRMPAKKFKSFVKNFEKARNRRLIEESEWWSKRLGLSND